MLINLDLDYVSRIAAVVRPHLLLHEAHPVKRLRGQAVAHLRQLFRIRKAAAHALDHAGVIERVCGSFPNPEELAQMRDGLPAQPLYRVRFMQKEVWPDYRGTAADVVEIEIYQHWLEPA